MKFKVVVFAPKEDVWMFDTLEQAWLSFQWLRQNKFKTSAPTMVEVA